VEQKVLQLKAISSEENLADIMTKPLDKKIFQGLMGKFMSVIDHV